MKQGHQLLVVFAELHMQSSQGDPVQQFSSQAFPSKHQLSSDLKLHPNTSWAQNWSSIQTPAGLRTEAPSKHQLGSELKLSHWVSAHKGRSPFNQSQLLSFDLLHFCESVRFFILLGCLLLKSKDFFPPSNWMPEPNSHWWISGLWYALNYPALDWKVHKEGTCHWGNTEVPATVTAFTSRISPPFPLLFQDTSTPLKGERCISSERNILIHPPLLLTLFTSL